MRFYSSFVLALVITWFTADPVHGQSIRYTAMFWNIHSGDSNAETIGDNMASKGKVDLWGLTEVPSDPEFLKTLEKKIEEKTGIDYKVKMSKAGGGDRLAILYNSERLKSEPYSGTAPKSAFVDLGDNFFELKTINTSGTVRPSMGIQLKGSGQSIVILVNHWKAKGDDRSRGIRVDQAEATNAFITQTPGIPIIIAGDHNIPIKNRGLGAQQRAFQTITRKAAYLAPDNERDRVGSFRSGSVLDSVFLAHDLPDWESTATIMNRPGNVVATSSRFIDNSLTSDHRPMRLVITGDTDTRIENLKQRIEATKQTLKQLEAQLEALTGAGTNGTNGTP